MAYLSGVLPQGSIGVGWASLKDLPPPAPAPATLELLEVDAALARIGSLAGAGSQAARRTALHDLFARATADEQAFLRGLLMGEIRQGALEGVMVDAVSRAADVPLPEVRRAAMVSGDLGATASAALTGGAEALARLPALAPHAAAADARAVRGGHPLGLRADPPGRRRMEARRRPHPDPPSRRRGPRVHAEPRRRHRSRPRDRGRDPRDPARRPRSSMPRRSRCDPTGAPTPSA